MSHWEKAKHQPSGSSTCLLSNLKVLWLVPSFAWFLSFKRFYWCTMPYSIDNSIFSRYSIDIQLCIICTTINCLLYTSPFMLYYLSIEFDTGGASLPLLQRWGTVGSIPNQRQREDCCSHPQVLISWSRRYFELTSRDGVTAVRGISLCLYVMIFIKQHSV